MKLALLLSSLFAAVTAKSMRTDSKAGMKLMANARALEDNFDEGIFASYSIMFVECMNSAVWSEEGFQQVGLVHFILCPTDYCSSDGCSSSNYGEYVVDMATYVDAYLESKLEAIRYKCETMREVCGCEDDDNSCMYYCYKKYGDGDMDWTQCANEQGDEERQGECQRLEANQDDDGRRRLDEEEEEPEYYLGPYCGPGGSGIYLTLYSDEECSVTVSNAGSIYSSIMGTSMPYQYGSGSSGLVKMECLDCLEPNQDQNDDDGADADEVIRLCEETYWAAAKCETNLADKYYQYTAGCNYIAALKGSAYSSTWISSSPLSGGAYFAIYGVVAAIVGAAVFFIIRRQKDKSSKRAPLMEAELTQQK